MILYLHGFRSAPASFKARLLAQRIQGERADHPERDWHCPQLPASPEQAIALAQNLIAQYCANPQQDLCLIGSSLGGFYATALAEQYGCRAVLLNPAVFPARDLHAHLGHTTHYHSDQPFIFLPEYVEQLKALEIAAISQPARYFLVAATGDEVLDWREMLVHYPSARHRIINGSDHGISDFAQYLDEVLAFADSKQAGAQ